MSNPSTHTQIKVEYRSDDDSMNTPYDASSGSMKVEKQEEIKSEFRIPGPSFRASSRGDASIPAANSVDTRLLYWRPCQINGGMESVGTFDGTTFYVTYQGLTAIIPVHETPSEGSQSRKDLYKELVQQLGWNNTSSFTLAKVNVRDAVIELKEVVRRHRLNVEHWQRAHGFLQA
jgi:hypothetical protein